MRIHTIVVVTAMLCTAQFARANLLQNSSFEEQGNEPGTARHWKINDPTEHGDTWGSAIRADWRANDGMNIGAIQGTWAGAGAYGGFWQEARIEAGKTYQASAWFWADYNWGAAVQELKLEFWSEDRTEKLGERSASLNDIRDNWTWKEVVMDAPAGAAWGRVVINVDQAGEEGALQVDQVSLESTSDY